MEVFDIDILLNERITQERAEHVLPHLADEACGYTEARRLHGDVCRCAAGVLLKNRDAGRRFACGGKIDQKFTECVKICHEKQLLNYRIFSSMHFKTNSLNREFDHAGPFPSGVTV